MLKIYFWALVTGLCLLIARPSAHAQRSAAGGTTKVAPGTGGGTGGSQPADRNPEQTPWSYLIDSLTANLDKSPITSDILYDRALPLAALHSFGTRRADTTSNAHLRQAYLELWIAAYNRLAFALTPDQLRERANRAVRHDSVPLAVLDYQFHWLDTLAVQDGLLDVQQGVLYDVPSPSRSPYLLRNLTLAAPLLDTLRQYTATFVLPPALLLSNQTRKVSGITVDFSDGGPARSLLPGQAVSITYPGNGQKVVWFTVQFNDGSTAQVRASIYVQVPTSSYRSIPVTLVNLGDVEAKIPFQDYDSSTSLYGKGNVLEVLHHPTSQNEYDTGQPIKLRRPVIILDGFDPQDDRQLQFNKGTIKSVYEDLRSQGILQLLDDQNLQRDLIILNFPVSPRKSINGTMTTTDVDGGADYVERNAMVLVELINRLKPVLDTDPATGQPYQFTIIGPSMGGLISRYALAYMEKQKLANAPVPAGAAANYWEHNTATWLSFDAPHQGAAVPMGDQAYLQFFQSLSAGARESLQTSLYSPGAKQMIVHHVLAPGTTPAGAPGFRDRFMLALRDNGEPGSLGYPVHLRRVALANGRLDGRGDPGGTPCGTMFDMDIRLRTGNAIAATVLSVLFFPIFRTIPPIQIAGCRARYAPEPGTSCQVFEGVLRYGIYGYGFPSGAYIYPVYGQRVVNSGSQGSYDLAPGGLRDTQESIARQAEASGRYSGGGGREQWYKVQVTDVHPNHCFIPTVSALGFQYQSTTSYQNTSSLPNSYTNLLTRGNLVCNNEIPFDDFYAPTSANTPHVTTNAGAVNFLIRELTPRVATPVFATAPAFICPSGQATFTVATCPLRAGQPPITYVWTAVGDITILSGQGTSTVTVVASSIITSTLSGLQVVATRPGYVDSAPASTSPFVRNGYLEINNGVSSPTCATSGIVFSITASLGVPAGAYYNWTTSDGYISSNNGGTSVLIDGLTFRDYQLTVTVSTPSPCGGPDIQAVYQQDYYTLGCPSYRTAQPGTPDPVATLYPNPATSSVDVHVDDADAARPVTVRLFDSYGRPCAEQASRGESILRLNTEKLPAGLYYVHLVQDGKVVKREQLKVVK